MSSALNVNLIRIIGKIMSNPERSMEEILASIRSIITNGDEEERLLSPLPSASQAIAEIVANKVSLGIREDIRHAVVESISKQIDDKNLSDVFNEAIFSRETEVSKSYLKPSVSEFEDAKINIRNVTQKFAQLAAMVEDRVRDIDHQNELINTLKRELHSSILEHQLGLRSNIQYFSMYVYLADTHGSFVVADCLRRLLTSFDYEITDEYEAIRGSWFKKWIGRYVEKDSAEEFDVQFSKMTRALELATVHKTQSGIDKSQAEAAASLITSLQSQPMAVCQVGSILLVKHSNGSLCVRTLTQQELVHIEKNPSLLKKPDDIIDQLGTFHLQNADVLQLKKN